MAIFCAAVDDIGGSLVLRKLWTKYGGNCACHFVSIFCSICQRTVTSNRKRTAVAIVPAM